jgi:hypothetical protein
VARVGHGGSQRGRDLVVREAAIAAGVAECPPASAAELDAEFLKDANRRRVLAPTVVSGERVIA